MFELEKEGLAIGYFSAKPLTACGVCGGMELPDFIGPTISFALDC